MTDDQGVLGNLPRSRPGQRSEKRTQPSSATTGKAAPRSRPRRKPASKPPPAPPPRRVDPITGAVRLAAEAGCAGVRLAGGVARGVFRRLPRI